MPTQRSDPIIAPLCFLIVATMILTIGLHITMFPTHEDKLSLQAESANFKYKTSTSRNRDGNRCALIRCGPLSTPRTNVRTTCDKVFVQITATKTNNSQRLCIIDYMNTYWDALSRTYNEGISYVADNLQLQIDTRHLPLEGKYVHFSFARNGMDIGADWFSVFPNNHTYQVFKAWSAAAINNTQLKDSPSPERASINRARSCKAKDVVCHARHILIAYQCDGVTRSTECVNDGHIRNGLRAMAIVVTITVCLRIVAASVATIAASRNKWSRARIWQFLMIPGQTRTGFATVALAFLAFGLLAALPWTAVVDTVGKGLGTKVVHRYEAEMLWGEVDVYKSVPDLRGTHDGYSYVFKDGHESLRVSGTGMEVVVWLTSFALFLRDVIHGGIVLKCLLAAVITKAVCGALVQVVAVRQKDLIVSENDYYDGKTEVAVKAVGKSKGRSFVVARDRGKTYGRTKEGLM